MTAILIGITCVSMNSLIGYSGRHYMDSIGSDISANSDSYKGEQEFFDPESADLDQEVTIIVNGAQESFSTTNWCITAVVTLLGGVLAYFVSGRALKPLHTFASRVENVQPNNLPDMKITDDVVREKHLTTVMVTHNLRYAVEYGSRLIMMNQGHIVMDKGGDEKANLNVDDILDVFNKISIECGN